MGADFSYLKFAPIPFTRLLGSFDSRGEAYDMDPQSLVNVTFGVILAGLGWFGRQLWDAVKELRTDLHKIEAELPRQYIAKDEFRHEIQEVKHICNEIFRKIDDLRDRKADK